MVFLYYAIPYYLGDKAVSFQWVNGELHPHNGAFGGTTQLGTVWYFQIGF